MRLHTPSWRKRRRDVRKSVRGRRLYDLAEMSREKALELAKPHLLDEAEMYERDALFLTTLRD